MVVAAPVADAAACDELRTIADEVVCLRTPDPLRSASEWFEDFSVPGSDELRRLLERARRPRAGLGHPASSTSCTGRPPTTTRSSGARRRPTSSSSARRRTARTSSTAARAEITKRLIAEHGFTVVAVEADWPDAYRVNRFVRGEGDDDERRGGARGVPPLPGLDVAQHGGAPSSSSGCASTTTRLPPGATKVGFYGLDLYSLHTSMEAVIAYLEEVDPEAAERARRRYACFDHFGRDPQVYAYEAGLGGAESCEQPGGPAAAWSCTGSRPSRSRATATSTRTAASTPSRTPASSSTPSAYYRAMFRGGISTWNLRDRHMADTLDALVDHLGRTRGAPPKAVVWEHNSHVGDARATELGQAGELNVGQLVRERHGRDRTLIVGFTTYTGTVTAASDWDGAAGAQARAPRARRQLGGALPRGRASGGCCIDTSRHAAGAGSSARSASSTARRRSASRTTSTRASPTSSTLVIHLDETHALEPLDRTAEWETGEVPDLYPWGV